MLYLPKLSWRDLDGKLPCTNFVSLVRGHLNVSPLQPASSMLLPTAEVDVGIYLVWCSCPRRAGLGNQIQDIGEDQITEGFKFQLEFGFYSQATEILNNLGWKMLEFKLYHREVQLTEGWEMGERQTLYRVVAFSSG